MLFGEGGEALARGDFVAGVAECAEDIGVLITIRPIDLGHYGINGGADGPAGVVARQHGPGERRPGPHASPNCSRHNGA